MLYQRRKSLPNADHSSVARVGSSDASEVAILSGDAGACIFGLYQKRMKGRTGEPLILMSDLRMHHFEACGYGAFLAACMVGSLTVVHRFGSGQCRKI